MPGRPGTYGKPRRYTLFGARMRMWRTQQILRTGTKLKQIEAAKLLGVSHSTYFRWETGRQLPMPYMMANVARVTGLSADAMWLDGYTLPPDMHLFLTTTIEGEQVVRNIRKVMNTLDLNQKPTHRRNIDPDHDPLPSENDRAYRAHSHTSPAERPQFIQPVNKS